MKKLLTVALTFTLALSFAACGDNNSIPSSTSEPKPGESVEDTTAVAEPISLALYGYMVIEDNAISLDEVEIIEPDDKERIAELGLTEQSDYPSGFCIYPLNKGIVKYELTDDTVYNFTDANLLFVKEEKLDRQYSTTSKDEFIKHVTETFYDSQPAPTVPFFVQIQDGKVISITEEYRFLI